MKKIFAIITVVAVSLMSAAAQDNNTGKLTRQERKALRAKADSIMYARAEAALADSMFVLEADEVVFKRGYTAHVTSSTNFVAVEGDRAVVQVAFNVPWSGFNGLGGITVEGIVSKYVTRKDRKGNMFVEMSVSGRGISAQAFITLMAGGNKASVTVMHNFHSGRITLNGTIVPADESSVFKGTSL